MSAAEAPDPFQRATAIIDLGAITRNCERLRERIGDRTRLCAVVKANGYGHGLLEAAEAAIRGGARWLAVAAATEAFELRPRLPERPILVMGALTDAELDVALQARADIAVWDAEFLDTLAERAAQIGFRARVHVKYDTGMGRLGNPDPDAVRAIVAACAADDRLDLGGLWTHFATADELEGGFFEEQLDRFLELAEPLRDEHPGLLLHAANSAATLREPRAHLDMVRCGVAVYGMDPFGEDPSAHGLEPVLSLRSYLAAIKRFSAGASAGYGRTWIAERDTDVGLLPIGYGDGVRRDLSNDCEVLIGGRRVPVAGTISMDNLTVDLGPDSELLRGEEAVLLGTQGDEEVTAEEWARRLGTINYEVTCGISPRVPRAYRR